MNEQPLFLDDFLAECEEHLSAVKQTLLALGSARTLETVDNGSIETLFRSLHSVKGNCGMVGLRLGEELSHLLEDYLRLLKNGLASLTKAGLNHLSHGTQTLERVIEAYSSQADLPDIKETLDDLGRFLEKQSSGKPGPKVTRRSKKASTLTARDDTDTPKWKFSFVPAPALDARGINVNTVRQRLLALGTLLAATPKVLSEGRVAFEFIVTTTAPEADFRNWRDDGIEYVAIEDRNEEAHSKPVRAPSTAGVALAARKGAMVRVETLRLNALMRHVGDLVTSSARLNISVKQAKPYLPHQDWRKMQEHNLALERQLRSLRSAVMGIRMVPLREVFDRLRFVVLNLQQELNIKVRLRVTGEATEVDKFLVDRLMDPMLHLVRNALTHGIEPADRRTALGKNAEGQLTLRARTHGDTVIVEVEDDGRGLDEKAILARARELALAVPDHACTSSELLDLICVPGFSLNTAADRASGRGVGMDVVQTTLAELGGSLTLATKRDEYTCFTLRMPLTLTVTDALIVSCGTQSFAIPQASVEDVIEVPSASIKTLENNEIVTYREDVLPLLRLSRYFHLPETDVNVYHALVIKGGEKVKGILVHRAAGLRQIVVHPLTDPLAKVPGLNGAAELGDGRPILILDAMTLVTAQGTLS